MKPRLLDLFCGAGGAAMGYHRAGFEVIGIDNRPQPHYPFKFYQLDALSPGAWVAMRWADAIHASPPCQPYSAMSACRPGLAEEYEALIEAVRQRLVASGAPYVIENVPAAPLIDPVEFCGQMFGLDLYRHRLFEASLPITVPEHLPHIVPASRAGHWKPGTIMSVAGHVAPIAEARRAMGIDWMNRDELAEAVPPVYTEWVGRHILSMIREQAA